MIDSGFDLPQTRRSDKRVTIVGAPHRDVSEGLASSVPKRKVAGLDGANATAMAAESKLAATASSEPPVMVGP